MKTCIWGGAAIILAARVAYGQTTTYKGPNTTNADRWNLGANWDNGVPSGATNVVIPVAFPYVTASSASTPKYTGNLTLQAGTTVQIGYTTVYPESYKALGTPGDTVISMAAGSMIKTRNGGYPVFPAINLLGNATIRLGESTQMPAIADFLYPITGSYALTVESNGQGTSPLGEFYVPNSFSAIMIKDITGRGNPADTFRAAAAGSLGLGDVTVQPNAVGGRSPMLWIDATYAMSRLGTLNLNGDGPADNGLNKLRMGANLTIAGLKIDGVAQAAGSYGKTGSGADYQVAWMNTLSTGFLTVAPASAGYWDSNGATAGAGGATPAGSWGSDAYWSPSAAGDAATAGWTPGAIAVFAAGTDAIGAYTVSVTSTQDIGGLIVQEGSVTLAAGSAGALRLTTNSHFEIAMDPVTIEAPIVEDGSARTLGKSGGGTLILSGASMHTGGTILEQGLLQYNALGAINSTAAADLTIKTAGVVLFGAPFGSGNIASALARIDPASTGVIAADNYAATDFDLSAAGLSAASFGALGNISYTGTVTPHGTTYRLGGAGGTLTLPGALTSTYALDVRKGTLRLNGFSASLGALSGTADAILENGHAATAITLAANQSVNSAFSGSVRNGGVASLALAKGGSGTLTLSGASSYSGGTTVSGGTITVGHNDALGTGTLTITANSTVDAAYGAYPLMPNELHVNDGVTLTTVGSTQYFGMTFAGAASGGGTIKTASSGNNASTRNKLGLTSDANTFTGTLINSGGGAVIAVNSLGDGGRIQLNANSSNAGGFSLNAGTATSLAFSVRQIELLGSSAIYNNNATASVTFTINTDLLVGSTGNKTFTLRGSNTGENRFAGRIANGSFNNAVQVISLLKEDAGKWILSGDNTFTGATTINAGTLVLAGSQCLSDTASLTFGTTAGRKLELRAGVKEKVGSLVFGTTTQANGTWGSTSSAASNKNDTYFAGTGVLYVGVNPPTGGTVILIL